VHQADLACDLALELGEPHVGRARDEEVAGCIGEAARASADPVELAEYLSSGVEDACDVEVHLSLVRREGRYTDVGEGRRGLECADACGRRGPEGGEVLGSLEQTAREDPRGAQPDGARSTPDDDRSGQISVDGLALAGLGVPSED